MTVERHLVLQQRVLNAAGEWTPPEHGWTVLRVAEGVGYLMQSGGAREMASGDVLVCSRHARLVLRASSLGELRLDMFYVNPQFLQGVLTVAEAHGLQCAETLTARQIFVFGANDPFAQKFKHLLMQPNRDSLPVRSGLLQLWSQAVTGTVVMPTATGATQRLRERFRETIGGMPDAKLAASPLAELAALANCSERHFSRLFREEFGVALRTRQTELRLLQASQMLSAPDVKVETVARQSGYRHLGLFNTMFKKKFGLTPSAWRKKIKSVSFLALIHLGELAGNGWEYVAG